MAENDPKKPKFGSEVESEVEFYDFSKSLVNFRFFWSFNPYFLLN